jgi:hypothetical protein
MRPLPNDVARCAGEDCEERESCKRYLTIPYDADEGRYTYSFFNPKTCEFKIEVDGL